MNNCIVSLLTGLLGNIGYKSEEEAHYLGARSIKFYIWPGSSLAKKAGRWIMAAELVDTTRMAVASHRYSRNGWKKSAVIY
jgi:ATP-dependent helicase HrpA